MLTITSRYYESQKSMYIFFPIMSEDPNEKYLQNCSKIIRKAFLLLCNDLELLLKANPSK